MGFFSGLLSAGTGGFTGLGTTLVGSVLGGAISNAFDQSNNAVTTKQNLEAQKQLFEYQNRNKYQFMVDDLNKAGLNPLLAVNGLQGSSVGGVSGSNGNTDVGHINSARAQAEVNRIANKQLEIDRLRAQAEADEKGAQRDLARAMANRLSVMTPIESKEGIARTALYQQQVLESSVNIDKLYADIDREKRITDAQILEIEANVKRLNFMLNGKDKVELTMLERARDSKSEEFKRDVLNSLYGEISAKFGYLLELQGLKPSAIGVSSSGNYGIRY